MQGNVVRIRERLGNDNQEFKNLRARHQDFEQRLGTLQQKSYLNETERLEERDLKKKTLDVKDKMEAIVRRHRTGLESTPAGN